MISIIILVITVIIMLFLFPFFWFLTLRVEFLWKIISGYPWEGRYFSIHVGKPLNFWFVFPI